MEILVLISFLLSSVGDLLFKEGDFFNAITEYKRELYFATSDSTLLLRKIALCYVKRGLFEEAASYYSDILYENPSTEVQRLFALSLTKAKKYSEARELLTGLKDSSTIILLTISEGLSGNYSDAFRSLDSFGINHPNNISLNKLNTASMILPGSGLLFLGDVPVFLGTLALSTFGGYVIYYYLKKGLVYEAIFSGYPIIERFYRGGIRNTKTKYRLYYDKFFKSLLSQMESKLIREEEVKLFSQ